MPIPAAYMEALRYEIRQLAETIERLVVQIEPVEENLAQAIKQHPDAHDTSRGAARASMQRTRCYYSSPSRLLFEKTAGPANTTEKNGTPAHLTTQRFDVWPNAGSRSSVAYGKTASSTTSISTPATDD